MNEPNEPARLSLRAGMVDPFLNKYIRELLLTSDTATVYLDDSLNTQWICANTEIDGLGAVLNRVAILEGRSEFLAAGKWARLASRAFGRHSVEFLDFFRDRSLHRIRCLLGEAVARILDGDGRQEAESILREAETLIAARNHEYSRRWYYSHARHLALLAAAFGVFLLQYRAAIALNQQLLTTLMYSTLGAIGAFVFTSHRGATIELDAMSGARVHRLESGARVIVGAISAALAYTLVEYKLVSGGIRDESMTGFLIIACFLAGYAERFIPNLVKEFGDGASKKSETPEPKEGA